MLDLRAKLLAAGLVTQDQVQKVEDERAAKKKRRREGKSTLTLPSPDQQERGDASESYELKQRQRQIDKLKSLPKNDQYEMIRKWVERNRLDHPVGLSEESEKYFYEKEDQSISWLTLEKTVHQQVTQGEAAIVAYMSNHGLTHCVMPREIAEDIGEVFPKWVRVLNKVTEPTSQP